MSYTKLSVAALPGKPQSFSAKTAAPEATTPHTGLFTELSVAALPGQIHSFTAKTEAEVVVPTGDHTGLFTALSVLALPGIIHSFTAKTEAEVEEEEEARRRPETSFPGARARRARIRLEEVLNDDEEILMILRAIAESGILE